MTEFLRTPDENFADLADFPFAPHFHAWRDLRMHFLDEGPTDGPVMLLLHGMPAWSYLYRTMIPGLVAAGFRCIAPDHLGFGRSDKPTDPNWYTIARHTEVLTSLVTGLGLTDITLVCQDWGGPIGLAQAATMPDRFRRLVIMNTWLHHPGYEYSEAVRSWNQNWHEGGIFDQPTPDLALLFLLTGGYAAPDTVFPALLGQGELTLDGPAAEVYRGFRAPYAGLPAEGFSGYRRFPLSIPFDDYDSGNGAAQELHYRLLLDAGLPTHMIWGCSDGIFTEAWGRTWAERMAATFDALPEANHFLQDTHGPEIVALLLAHIAAGN